MNSIFYSLIGGGLIGIAATIMLYATGRITGISGILSLSLSKPRKDELWRWLFLSGLIIGGTVANYFQPDLFVNNSQRSPMAVFAAGLLVGYGTLLGGGCTSGHGVCGISRLSVRSIIATVTFMLLGFITVQIFKYIFGN